MRHALVIRSKVALLAFLLLACPGSQAVGQGNGARAPAAASPPDDGQWTMAAKDYASTRFSALGEINRANVSRLKLAFSFDTQNRRGHEAAPLVVGSMMYIITPYPNHVWALDLARGGRLVWVFRPRPKPASQGVACCDVVNRGGTYSNGNIYFATLDGDVFAIRASNGHQVWRTSVADINKGETVTMAPLVAEGKVLVGNSGGEFGVRGWLTALDAASGKLAWRAYSTGPDADVLIGPQFKPFYAMDRGKDLGVKSWPPEAWKTGGGTTWGWISYDPATRTLFQGTGNAGPWNPHQRPGDNKWTSGVFARDIATGQARWFYQSSPHDHFDHDDINESILLDMPVGGRMRQVLVRPGRNGYMYVIDRGTGQVLSADPYGFINSAKGVDLKTGRLIPVEEKVPQEGRVTRNICPAAPGAKDWNPSAFSPRTGLLYVPHLNLCMDMGVIEANYIAGTPYLGAEVKMYAGPGGHRGVLTAWDPVRRKAAWEIREDLPLWSGALATAGDLVFYGTMDGRFKAVDGRTGKLLWQEQLESGIIGQPITYRGPDGRQYVAILSGVGGWAGAIVSGQLDPGDPTSALGFVNAMRDLPGKTKAGGRLYVFALPQ
ncbi:PQQ-dependent dehydrogenase, methanol/ethanol family [Sphingomonas parva]|uniref:PQQ-dependent dehydrogenase, methanol/ethanol family n=1 Tax=Sphingomonas parva TaxID=2555898 RepID=A0A4Y8ZS83_9SPHN|nr:PQQ-dependent dehydrogenase, methanol/ethanol family [Sphingomonas parva]TFI58881.1 PQQ-dependent dehydrogenase, methanol/ethanol family [Sphingomonas parva]